MQRKKLGSEFDNNKVDCLLLDVNRFTSFFFLPSIELMRFQRNVEIKGPDLSIAN